jgi:hypothetical protein
MKKIFLFLGTMAVLSGCKKSNDSPATTSSRTALLTAKSWRLTAATFTLNGIPVPSSNFFPDCSKDDLLKFNADKTLIKDESTVKCNASDPQTQAGTWAFSSDESKLTIAVPNSPLNGEADIKELTATSLHVYGTRSLSGAAITLDATFVPN